MSRVTRGLTTHAKHKRVLSKVKGYKGRRKSTIKLAKQALVRTLNYRGISNRLKRRQSRSSAIEGINEIMNEQRFNYKLITNLSNSLKLKLGVRAILYIIKYPLGLEVFSNLLSIS
ncbi:MAG: 50S ribosomal protein L20 [Candidatus Hodgkinia cicadicola]